MVPLSLLPVFAICRGRFPFFDRRPDGTYERRLWSARSIGFLVLGIAVGAAGAYYAFFACAFTAFAGLYSWAVDRTWRAPAAAAGVVAVITVVGLIHHLPSILYQWEYARNPITDRQPEEADAYGMKIAHLVLPIPDHNLSILANLRVRYLVPNRPCEGENSGSLGIIGPWIRRPARVILLPSPRWPYGPSRRSHLRALQGRSAGSDPCSTESAHRSGPTIASACSLRSSASSRRFWALDHLSSRPWPVPLRT